MVTTLPLMHSKIKPRDVEDTNLCCRVSNFSSRPICSHSLSNFTAVTNSSSSELKGRSGVKSLGKPATVFGSSSRSSRRDECAVGHGCCSFSRDGVSLTWNGRGHSRLRLRLSSHRWRRTGFSLLLSPPRRGRTPMLLCPRRLIHEEFIFRLLKDFSAFNC